MVGSLLAQEVLRDYTADDIINATLLDVFLKKEASVKNGDNRMTYMQNVFTYISQRSFEPFLEMIKTGVKIPTAQTKRSVDI